MAATPAYLPNTFANYVVDKPLTQVMCQNLNSSAKFSVVNTEVIYMGEYYNGQTVPRPVSPVDGHQYAYTDSGTNRSCEHS